MTTALIEATVELEYWLALNAMTANTEQIATFGPFPTKAAAHAWYNEQLVEPYDEPGTSTFSGQPTTWRKTFRKGSDLEWMNPLSPAELEEKGMFGRGLHLRFGQTHSSRIIQIYE